MNIDHESITTAGEIDPFKVSELAAMGISKHAATSQDAAIEMVDKLTSILILPDSQTDGQGKSFASSILAQVASDADTPEVLAQYAQKTLKYVRILRQEGISVGKLSEVAFSDEHAPEGIRIVALKMLDGDGSEVAKRTIENMPLEKFPLVIQLAMGSIRVADINELSGLIRVVKERDTPGFIRTAAWKQARKISRGDSDAREKVDDIDFESLPKAVQDRIERSRGELMSRRGVFPLITKPDGTKNGFAANLNRR